MTLCSHNLHDQIKLQFPLFLATNKGVISTIPFLQCMYMYPEQPTNLQLY